MIRSMTGFGAARFEVDGASFDLEMRAVNHRYLDLRVKLPRAIASLEGDVKSRVQERLARGKVDVGVVVAGGNAALQDLDLDFDLAGRYALAAARLAREHELVHELEAAALLSLPGVIQFVDRSLETPELTRGLSSAVDAALDALVAMRLAEGEAMERDLRARLDRVLELTDSLEARSGEVVRSARERLRRRAEQLREDTGILDEARLHQEIVIAADKMDVSEELVRLRSHVDQFRALMKDAGEREAVGRKLDFLLQEMGREANTLGSKGGDAETAHAVVELKAELERIREQVQNVE